LQPVDQIINLVDDVDAVAGGDEPGPARIADDIWYRIRTDIRAFEVFDGIGRYGQATEKSPQHNDDSDPHFLTP